MYVTGHNVNVVLLVAWKRRYTVVSSVFKISTNENKRKSKSSLYPTVSLASMLCFSSEQNFLKHLIIISTTSSPLNPPPSVTSDLRASRSVGCLCSLTPQQHLAQLAFLPPDFLGLLCHHLQQVFMAALPQSVTGFSLLDLRPVSVLHLATLLGI